ncbi:pyridoxamine 5'-phosphate oxidase [Clostridia bacterium]|nr:pyridoxamine 5'-phosphate oxidase [Clostridia bacterium]
MMRKADREVKDRGELIAILEKCDVCRIGLALGGVPYIVPMNFGYEMDGDDLILYLHCAKEGRKLDFIAQNPNACFEMDCSHELKPGTEPCNYSMNYESIIGSGLISVCEEKDEKIHGLTQLMRGLSAEKTFHFPDKVLDQTAVLKFSVTEFTGKRLRK